MNEPPSKDTPRTLWRRRDALTMVGWTAVVGSLLTGVGAFFRLLFRRAPVQQRRQLEQLRHPADA